MFVKQAFSQLSNAGLVWLIDMSRKDECSVPAERSRHSSERGNSQRVRAGREMIDVRASTQVTGLLLQILIQSSASVCSCHRLFILIQHHHYTNARRSISTRALFLSRPDAHFELATHLVSQTSPLLSPRDTHIAQTSLLQSPKCSP